MLFRGAGGAATAAAVGELVSVFSPGIAHVVAERRRRELDCEHLGAGAPPLGVDLDRGIVRITLPPDGSGAGPS
jgi:hypothetical protein